MKTEIPIPNFSLAEQNRARCLRAAGEPMLLTNVAHHRWVCPWCKRRFTTKGGCRQHLTKMHTMEGRRAIRAATPHRPTFNRRREKHRLIRTALIGVLREDPFLTGKTLRYEARLLAYREVRFMLGAAGVKLSVSDRREWESIKSELANRI